MRKVSRPARCFLTNDLRKVAFWHCDPTHQNLANPRMQTPAGNEAPQLDPGRWVDEHGDCLYRFALLRVRKPEIAEDLVQDTLFAGMRAAGNFSGRSSERSWLVGILKHKIADHFRKHGRETPFTDMEFLRDEMPHKFEDGFWNHDTGPKEWAEPEAVTYSGEFWQTMRDCLTKLPPRVADAFMMQELDDAGTPEICESPGISHNNLWMMLHRARMALRECLEANWFGKSPQAPMAIRDTFFHNLQMLFQFPPNRAGVVSVRPQQFDLMKAQAIPSAGRIELQFSPVPAGTEIGGVT